MRFDVTVMFGHQRFKFKVFAGTAFKAAKMAAEIFEFDESPALGVSITTRMHWVR